MLESWRKFESTEAHHMISPHTAQSLPPVILRKAGHTIEACCEVFLTCGILHRQWPSGTKPIP